jgi:Uma2 family endonuclease
MATATQLTIEDFERLPAEEAKNELVDGELVPVSGNTLQHNDLRDQVDLASEALRPRASSRHDSVRAGVRLQRQCTRPDVWILSIDTEEILVYSDHGNRILEGAEVLQTDLLPGFSTTIADLFAGV